MSLSVGSQRQVAHQISTQDYLKTEMAWGDVAKGFERILFGYVLMIACAVFAGLLLGWLATQGASLAKSGTPDKPNLIVMWVILLGGAIIGFLSLVSWFVVVTGQFKCALGAPDRENARWLMFGCILCLVFGFVLPILDGVSMYMGGGLTQDQLQKMQSTGDTSAITRRGSIIQMAGLALDVTVALLMAMFFRAVGKCFAHQGLVDMADSYMLCFVLLICGTGFVAYTIIAWKQFDIYMIGGAGVCWLLMGLWHVFMIIYARNVIVGGMDKVLNSPLTADIPKRSLSFE